MTLEQACVPSISQPNCFELFPLHTLSSFSDSAEQKTTTVVRNQEEASQQHREHQLRLCCCLLSHLKSAEQHSKGFKGNLVDWVNQLSSLGRSKDAIDEALCGKGHDDDIMQLLKIACTCVISRPKDRPSMYNVYQSLKSMAEEHGFSEHFDEFPLNVGKQDLDNKE